MQAECSAQLNVKKVKYGQAAYTIILKLKCLYKMQFFFWESSFINSKQQFRELQQF